MEENIREYRKIRDLREKCKLQYEDLRVNLSKTNSILHDINTTQFPALTASLRNIEVQSELVSTLFKASSQASESSDFQQIPLFNLDDQGAVQNQHMS
ncbi:hypothetical protein DSO57_1008114 [Entomophthora muscae]|uniref:Uncharacterized protein n=2 Tax=Entomophthora muscae TaxID=34485 RepID=A0ACC2T790_9FUNG|nr:hypothetical protein DSO57_1009170 [Entomophthora muscae]KAJ9078285.1 hypothetical protein DSO57_1008114 [Entomophthora muscae]